MQLLTRKIRGQVLRDSMDSPVCIQVVLARAHHSGWTDLWEGGALCQLLDGVTPVAQDAAVAVDVGDAGDDRGGVGVPAHVQNAHFAAGGKAAAGRLSHGCLTVAHVP